MRTTKAKSKTDKKPPETIDRSILEEKLGYQMRITENVINKSFVQNVGMTPVQYSVFSLVANNEGASQSAIGESLSMDRASTMAIMDKLENAGLVERRKSPIDRRMHALHLTTKGKREITTVEKKVRAVDTQLKEKLTEKQLQILLKYLNLLRI